MQGRTSILAVGSAFPAHRASQALAQRFATRVIETEPPGPRRERALELVSRIYPGSGIRTRQSVLGDFSEDDPARFRFFPPTWTLEPFPGTAARLRVYERESVGLAEGAARRALERAGVEPGRVSHLLVCSCTGFFAPGPDVLLVERLGLSPTVGRAVLGFMGCYAGLSGLRLADRIVCGDPEAVVLQVCVELCTIHYQKRLEPDFVVANCLFADGAAAAVYAGAAGSRGFRIVATRSELGRGSLEQMSWRIGDRGFEMRLQAQVPRSLEGAAPGFVDALAEGAGLKGREEVGRWGVHPGGLRILEAVARSLELGQEEMAPSLGVLRDHGNLSSATLLVLLERELEAGRGGGDPMALLGFGPGLTIEGALLA